MAKNSTETARQIAKFTKDCSHRVIYNSKEAYPMAAKTAIIIDVGEVLGTGALKLLTDSGV